MRRRQKSRPINVRIPSEMLSLIDEVVKLGRYRNRSAVVNEAVKILLENTLWGLKHWDIKRVPLNGGDAVISFRLKESYFKYLEELVASGMFHNRSEAIKTALFHLLKAELQLAS